MPASGSMPTATAVHSDLRAAHAPVRKTTATSGPPSWASSHTVPRQLARAIAIAAPLACALLLAACLPAFAPSIRARGPHRGLSPAAADPTCMTCHVSAYALRDDPALARAHAAPIVPAWMLTDPRGCVGCHVVREPRR
jgi:hypothetical protein